MTLIPARRRTRSGSDPAPAGAGRRDGPRLPADAGRPLALAAATGQPERPEEHR